ncbi:carboxypeptidase-like regulatory domain-containing protein [Limibacter armeniacum]|uniref:TonB-dependent receptor n=1 Tax=Limibacter armeniacum TaxID=466084 RepID=UPI002FE5475F
MKVFVTFISLFLICSFAWGQTSVKGRINDEKGAPIQGASVIAYPVGQNTILGFGISSEDGAYNVSLKNPSDSVQVTVRSLGFEIQSRVISIQNLTADFTMITADKYLKELEIKADPITAEGDTINYTTDAFAREGDESLEDVLKRLPGVEVSKNGTISYQGRSINKFYIEGKDLLGGQYTIASKNLPKNAVASIEVIKDHQPIKMLQDVVHSIDPAINIVLKEGVTVTGNAEVGGGVPSIWYGKLTPMLFNKKHQSVNVISSTNSGRDELSMFNYASLYDFLEFGGVMESNPPYLLGIPPIENNLFNKSEYNDHQTHVITTNYITGFGKGDLKVNIDAYDDLRFQESITDLQYFIPNDTIQIQNSQRADYREKYLKTRLTFEHNEKEGYFNNVFHFKVKDHSTVHFFITN